jgi:predicted ATP-dependent endonuclease of OLD family
MRISQVEISNFRKLVAVRIDLGKDKTVFVGANNSGKTSAMTALRRFLVDPRSFNVNDFSLTHWMALDEEGSKWEKAYLAGNDIPVPLIADYLPQLDIWLEVGNGEMHYARKLLPTLDWKSGPLGVRLRYEPDDMVSFQQEFLKTRAKGAQTLAAAQKNATHGDPAPNVELWPQSLVDFLDRKAKALFTIKAYLLDPSKLVDPEDGVAKPQPLPVEEEPLKGNPLDGLIQIDEISAQRGFGMSTATRATREDGIAEPRAGRRLSNQLRSYYDNHLDWQDTPELTDIKAMAALETARQAFDERLAECFAQALQELEKLGYPGVSDPKLKIATKLRLQDGLNHDAAVQYEISSGPNGSTHRLPEDSNGLGYQNLVSMVFGLMRYRDAWMKVGKPSTNAGVASPPAPLHLVIVEEPEAYLHAQVQQVFIKQAYDVLRNHPELGDSSTFTTQLVVSTHSSHVAHACDFSTLRYFRRLPANTTAHVPTACVVNLSTVFGSKADQTEKFVARYLKATHCDLFFADGAVFIEGAAERILVPHFVEERSDFEYLKRCYVSWLEIGGSHAHRFRSLVEKLGLTTLIITDLDAKDPTTGTSEIPVRGKGLEARNETLRTWSPEKRQVDELLDIKESDKAIMHPSGYGVRAAYQTPTKVTIGATEEELLANTFEDALFYQNLDFFRDREGTGLAGKFKDAIATSTSAADLVSKAKAVIAQGVKAEFALDLLYSDDIDQLETPEYIKQGLLWLIEQLKRKEEALAPKGGAA